MITTDEDLKNKHYGPLIATCVGIIVVLGGFSLWQAKPLYHFFQRQRALQYVEKIDAHIQSGDFTEAHQLAFDAYHMAPKEPEILRVAARLAMAMRSPESRFFLNRLVELGDANFDDRRDLLETYLRLGESDRAINLANQLHKEGPDDLKLLKLLVELLNSQEKPVEAMHVLGKIVELDPNDPKHRLQFARLLIIHGTGEERDKGWKFVWSVAQDDTIYGIQAINLLLQADDFPPAMDSKIITRIAIHPLAEEAHHVAALHLAIDLNPLDRRQIIDEAVAQRRDWPVDKLGHFFRWLNKEKEYAVVLDSLTLERARESEELLVFYLNAMGHEGQWKEVREILKDPSLPLDEPKQLMFSALCAQRLGDDETIIEELLQKAINAATRRGSFDQTFNTASFAEAVGLAELAEMAYTLSLRSNAVADRAFKGLQRLAEAQDDAFKLRNVTEKYHRRFPRRPEIVEHYLYLNALVGIEVETTLEKSLLLVQEEPYRIPPRIILALSSYRMNDFISAAKACEPCNLEEMTGPQKAVYAAIAAAVEKPEIARLVANEVTADGLLEEEKRLLGSLQSL